MDEMEALYFRLHAQLLRWLQRLLTPKSRRRLEALLFALAAHLLLLGVLLHVSFVGHWRVDCLGPLIPAELRAASEPRDVLLRVQIVGRGGVIASAVRDGGGGGGGAATAAAAAAADGHDGHDGRDDVVVDASFVFATQRALLALVELQPPFVTMTNASDGPQIPTLRLPRESPCLALAGVGDNALWTLFRSYVLGYDTIVTNLLTRSFGARGFVYREAPRRTTELRRGGALDPEDAASSWLLFAAFKFKVAHTILFLFFILTALVAFVLTETQKRMITFAGLFQNRSHLQIPFANLVLVYFAQSLMFVPVLVGMLFFLFELYKDHLLAFAVMSLVWLGESFSVISVRSRLAQVYFPALFFCLFAGLHLYVFSFPFGFTYVALAAASALLLLLLLFFCNNFEIPALRRGEVSALTPREPLLLSY